MCTSFLRSFSQRTSEAGELLSVIHFTTESTWGYHLTQNQKKPSDQFWEKFRQVEEAPLWGVYFKNNFPFEPLFHLHIADERAVCHFPPSIFCFFRSLRLDFLLTEWKGDLGKTLQEWHSSGSCPAGYNASCPEECWQTSSPPAYSFRPKNKHNCRGSLGYMLLKCLRQRNKQKIKWPNPFSSPWDVELF